jgi:hypothetical protein
MQNDIRNDAYGSQALDQWNSPNAEAIIDHVFGAERGARIRAGLNSARLTADAMSMGENLAVNAGTANARDVLRQFQTMTPAQQSLFRRGFSTKLRSLINGKADRREVVSQFNNENARNVFRAILPDDEAIDAEGLIRGLAREEITTDTKNAIYGNSKTGETTYDINENTARDAARTVRHAATGKFLNIIDDWGNALARQVGQQRATEVVRTLTEMNPPDMLRTLDRLITRAQTDAEANTLWQMRRQIVQQTMQGAGTIEADKPMALKRQPHASGGSVHADRLNALENSGRSPQEKAAMRRAIIEDALKHP